MSPRYRLPSPALPPEAMARPSDVSSLLPAGTLHANLPTPAPQPTVSSLAFRLSNTSSTYLCQCVLIRSLWPASLHPYFCRH